MFSLKREEIKGSAKKLTKNGSLINITPIQNKKRLLDKKISKEDEKKILKAYTNELKTLEDKEKKTKADYERIVDLYKLIDAEEEKIKASKKHIKMNPIGLWSVMLTTFNDNNSIAIDKIINNKTD